MKSLVVFALLLAAAVNASAQVSSHAPTATAKQPTPSAVSPHSSFQISDKPVPK